MESPNEEILQKMSYTELRKYARKSGIKGNRKADDLIASILGKRNHDKDEFDTMERKLINSSTKNKEEQFNADKSLSSATPRRETYTIDTPLKEVNINNEEFVPSSASPELKSIVHETNLNINMTRGSEKKSKKHKVSFQTPLRRSERLSLLTPKFASVKDRPKTPIPSRGSSGIKKHSISDTLYQADENKNRNLLGNISGDGKERQPSTPMLVSKCEGKKQTSAEKGMTKPSLGAAFKIETPLPLLQEVDSERSTPRSGLKQSHTPSSIKHVKITPKFSKIHEKEFNKMESLGEYAKRLTATAEKRAKEQEKYHIPGENKKYKKDAKMPKAFGGIPFIPSAPVTKCNFVPSRRKPNDTPGNKSMATSFLNTSVLNKTQITAGKTKVLQASTPANASLKKKNVFDLKESLSRKLPYKPHRGPLKPLSENNLDCTLPLKITKTQESAKANEIVKANRIQSRSVLKGVRTNRRFELQMKNRKHISV